MGLIKAGVGAAGGVMADQWREYFYCESLPADVLVAKGQKRTSRRSSNRKGEENIISNGSIVAVADGQFMMIVEQGKIVEFTDEPGEFLYDTSTEPSLFYGGFGKGLLDSFKTFGKRFTFGGDTAKDQRVYYFNKKEIMGNRYGTPNPIPFRVVDKNIGLDIDVAIRCHGEYSYRLVDPILFYVNVCGNVASIFNRSQIDSQLKTELMTALQPAFAKISAMGIRYSALPGHTEEIAKALNDVLTEKWAKTRGIALAAVGVSSVTASEEDENMIKQLQKSAVMRDPNMAAATLVGAQSDAMRAAAENKGGAMMGFMGLGMATQAGGANAANLFAMGQQNRKAEPEASENMWKCACGAENKSNFCSECGTKKPEDGWFCTSCGAKNKSRFCSECGTKKPADGKIYACDKCGWTPEDPAKPPRFCPECGDPFTEEDAK
ncbi:MAG TPA: SPFH domain-containing protein [Clostridiales bacterium]|nr:SPFH domain-containing protein [Clostridiales bacterium]